VAGFGVLTLLGVVTVVLLLGPSPTDRSGRDGTQAMPGVPSFRIDSRTLMGSAQGSTVPVSMSPFAAVEVSLERRECDDILGHPATRSDATTSRSDAVTPAIPIPGNASTLLEPHRAHGRGQEVVPSDERDLLSTLDGSVREGGRRHGT